jgi:hypothetical protein
MNIIRRPEPKSTYLVLLQIKQLPVPESISIDSGSRRQNERIASVLGEIDSKPAPKPSNNTSNVTDVTISPVASPFVTNVANCPSSLTVSPAARLPLSLPVPSGRTHPSHSSTSITSGGAIYIHTWCKNGRVLLIHSHFPSIPRLTTLHQRRKV